MKLTREEAKDMLPIIQAWADGKTVDWYDEDIGWRASGFELDFGKNPKFYRINSEPESKYRPFKSQDECWTEMLKHQPFGWIINKDYSVNNINALFDTVIKIGESYKSYLEVFNLYKFIQ